MAGSDPAPALPYRPPQYQLCLGGDIFWNPPMLGSGVLAKGKAREIQGPPGPIQPNFLVN